MQAMRKQAALMAFMAPPQNMGEEPVMQLTCSLPRQMDYHFLTLLFSYR